MNKLAALLTGSRAYGTPRDDSDIDLVVFGTQELVETLTRLATREEHPEIKFNKGTGSSDRGLEQCQGTFRFGRLNLIVVTDIRDFEIWKQGTANLRGMQDMSVNVTREDAIAHFRKLKDELGSQEPSL